MTEYDEREIFREAQRLKYTTSLNDREAIVAVAAKHGLSDGEIGTVVGRSASSVQRIRDKLLEKRLKLETEAERTIEALEEI